MSATGRTGIHAPVTYVFEDNGFDADPADTDFKGFGSNTTVDSFDADNNLSRNYNSGRTTDEIVEQVFEGSWGVSFNLGGHAPWWLAGLFGQPNSSEVTTGFHKHVYDFSNDNDPVSLRLYLPTDGFSEYVVVPGVVIEDVSIDQSQGDEPDVSLSCSYAREPFTASDLDPAPPEFRPDQKFTNRDAELTVGADTVGRLQNASMSWPTGNEMTGEIGSGQQVDFAVRRFEPETSYDHIVRPSQTVDFFNRFTTGSDVTIELLYDNGLSSDAEFAVDFTATGAVPSTWSETGRNDDADLIEELSEMVRTASAEVRTDETTPPGV